MCVRLVLGGEGWGEEFYRDAGSAVTFAAIGVAWVGGEMVRMYAWGCESKKASEKRRSRKSRRRRQGSVHSRQMLVEVNVPDHVNAGEAFLISYDGQDVYVTCPPDCLAGDLVSFEIDVPASNEPASDELVDQVEVTIPDGCYPGQQFSVNFEGETFNIDVPEGSAPGERVLVALPREGELQAINASSFESEPPSNSLQAGATVLIDGLQSKPYFNGERASLISWDPNKGRWKVAVGSGDEATVLALKPSNLRPVRKKQRRKGVDELSLLMRGDSESPVSVCAA